MKKLTPIYAIADSRGNQVGQVNGTMDQAVEAFLSKYGRTVPLFFDGDLAELEQNGPGGDERKQNPPNLADSAAALKALGNTRVAQGPISLSDVLEQYPDDREGLHKAFLEVQHYMPQPGQISLESMKKRTFKEHGSEYARAASYSSALLVSNAKTTKAESGEAGIPASLSEGLAFAPHKLLKADRITKGIKFLETQKTLKLRDGGKEWVLDKKGKLVEVPTYTRLDVEKHRHRLVQQPKPPEGFVTVCVGASTACRNSCLLYSGQNQAVEASNTIKALRLQAFLLAPEAFIRLYYEAIRKFVAKCDRDGIEPYVRHNILSDIPWEYVCPELMTLGALGNHKLPRNWEVGRAGKAPLRFYDYTKVVNRNTSGLGKAGRGDRYDLTFSFSGDNWEECNKEFAGGRRIAVVFLRRPHKLNPNTNVREGGETLDDIRVELDGDLHKVIDGDKHDMRPRDPQKTIIGLRFKARESYVWDVKAADMILKTVERQQEDAAAFLKRPGAPVPNQHWLIRGFQDARGNVMVAETPRATCSTGDVGNS